MNTSLHTRIKSRPTSCFAPVPTVLLQRKCDCGQHTVASCECARGWHQRAGTPQHAAINPSPVHDAPPIVHEVLRSPGQPLDVETRAFMEPRFGHDFGAVRVHTDTKATESAQAVNALAYTVGRDIVFGSQQYSTTTVPGLNLLAHELTHVMQQAAGSRAREPASTIEELFPTRTTHAESEAQQVADQVMGGGRVGTISSGHGASNAIQRKQLGTRVTHPAGSTSPYRVIAGDYDGRDFILRGDSTELMRLAAQSGRPYTVRPADARSCGGSLDDSYLNNPRYVGIADNGPIPEGEYQFRATSMATFGTVEQLEMMSGGSFTDPFGASLHGGDWGAGRVAVNKIRVLPGRRGCGNTATRSGFYLHGGVMPGSSGCIDIGNSGIGTLVGLLRGYRGQVVVTVRYRHPAPNVSMVDRALGRFTYPGQEHPTYWDRVESLFRFSE